MKYQDFVIDEEAGGYIGQFFTNYIKSFDFPSMLGEGQFVLKTNEFHVSLVKLPLEIDDKTRVEIERVSIEVGRRELIKNPPRLNGNFRRAEKDGRQTIIGLADFPAVEIWREAIRKIVPNLEFSVPHTTLYVNPGQGGIGLNSDTEYEELTRELDPEAYQILHKIWESKQ